MNFKAFFTMPLAFLMMLVSLIGSPKTEGIAVVYVRQRLGFRGTREYKIDLARKNLWEHSYGALLGGQKQPRNEKALFEGFRFAGRLEDEKIAAFRAAATAYGFDTWEGNYEPDGPIIADGTTWLVTIVFADGTRRSSREYDAWPEHWDKMRQAFEALTGMNIL
jgi:hypothetical protein